MDIYRNIEQPRYKHEYVVISCLLNEFVIDHDCVEDNGNDRCVMTGVTQGDAHVV